jgi:hypothetical protein
MLGVLKDDPAMADVAAEARKAAAGNQQPVILKRVLRGASG